ncbi:MAG: hypothetical protein HQL86_02865 [Magnetococcales bacterium]|nr:hypothetical protein [Magnetococcales bacterium]
MSWIALQPMETATGKTREIYELVAGMMGRVPEAMQLFGHSPILMEYMNTRFAYFHGQQQDLTPELMRWILFLNARRKACVYCIDYNKGQLLASGISEEILEAAAQDPQSTPLPEKEKTMLLFVLDAARDDKSVTQEKIDAVRRAGYSDAAIFNAMEFTAFATFSDTLLNVFQVES